MTQAPYLRFSADTDKDAVERRLHERGFGNGHYGGYKSQAVGVAISTAQGDHYNWLTEGMADKNDTHGWTMYRDEYTSEEEFFQRIDKDLEERNKPKTTKS